MGNIHVLFFLIESRKQRGVALHVRFLEREIERDEGRKKIRSILLFPLIFEFLWPSPHLPPRPEENKHKVCVPLLDMPLRRGGRERVRATLQTLW